MVEIKKLIKKLLTATNISIILGVFTIVIMLYQIILAKPGTLTVEWKPNESLVPTERFSDYFVLVDICESDEFSINCLLPTVSNTTNKTISNLNVDYSFISKNAISVGAENTLFDVSSSQGNGVNKTTFHFKANSLGPFDSVKPPMLSSLNLGKYQSVRFELRVTHEGIREPLQLRFEVLPAKYSNLNIEKLAEDNSISQEEVLSAIETDLFKFVQARSVQKNPLYVVVSTLAGKSFIFDTRIHPKRIQRFADDRSFKFNYYSIRRFFEKGFTGYLHLFFALFFILAVTLGVIVFLQEAIDDIRSHHGWKNCCLAIFCIGVLVFMILSFGFKDHGFWFPLN